MFKVLDVTLRDGGLANNFGFTMEEATEITAALSQSGIETIEVGYFRPDRWEAQPGGATCDPSYLAEVCSAKGGASLSVMVHTQHVDVAQYARLPTLGVDLVRFTLSDKNIDTVQGHCRRLEEIGLPYCVNFIRISQFDAAKVSRYALALRGLRPASVYFADSNGSIFPGELRSIISHFASELEVERFGIHAHDNLGFAFANSVVGLEMGFEYVDASIGGLGKGGNNLETERIGSYLNWKHGAGYDIQRIESVRRRSVEPWLAKKQADRFSNMIFGFLDMNHDEVEEIIAEAAPAGIPVSDLLRQRYPRIFGKPAALEALS